jgi:hypothetical protein
MMSPKWRKLGKQGGGLYEERNALLAPQWKNMFYKVTSRYIAKFLAGH